MFEFDASPYVTRNGYTLGDFQGVLDAQGTWFHSFEFTNGARTNGRDPTGTKMAGLALPDISGLSVIDIGAFDGYFSFQAERLGAKSVLATDEDVWIGPTTALSNFKLMKRVLNSRVKESQISVERLSPKSVGSFDVSLFLGVLYHAPNMIEYLERVRSVTKRFAVVETLVDLLRVEGPAAAFYPPGVINGDHSNFWGPNLMCVEEMLKRVGFGSVQFKGIWDRNTLAQLRGKAPEEPPANGRATWHAYV